MIDQIPATVRCRSVATLVTAIALIALLTTMAACSGEAPTQAPPITAPAPTETPAIAPTVPPTAPPATSTASPTVAPATATVPPQPARTPAGTAAVDPDKLSAISGASDEVYHLLEELIAELGPRASGSEEELRAAEYLKQQYHSMGYQTEIQPFPSKHIPVASMGGLFLMSLKCRGGTECVESHRSWGY